MFSGAKMVGSWTFEEWATGGALLVLVCLLCMCCTGLHFLLKRIRAIYGVFVEY